MKSHVLNQLMKSDSRLLILETIYFTQQKERDRASINILEVITSHWQLSPLAYVFTSSR